MKKFWIHAGTLIDGTGAEPKKNQAICVENGRVAAIEDFHGKNEEEWVDLSEMTVMPGMINCHVHSLSPVGDRKSTRLNSSHIGSSRMPSSA